MSPGRRPLDEVHAGAVLGGAVAAAPSWPFPEAADRRAGEDDDVADTRIAEAVADAIDEDAFPTCSVGTIDSLGSGTA